MTDSTETDNQKTLRRKLAAWSERASLAQAYKQAELEQALLQIVSAYEFLLQSDSQEPEWLLKANVIRKKIEAAEQHRTMSAEHGLNDEAIDVTYEIKALEKELLDLVRR